MILADLPFPVIASRWLHIAAVITAVGGTIFLRLVLLPAAKAALDDAAHQALRAQVIRRWARIVHISIAIILLSGIYNAIVVFPQHPGQPLYHALFGVKIILALVVFFIATALAGRSQAFAGMRSQTPRWMAINILIALAVVLISNVLKNIPLPPAG